MKRLRNGTLVFYEHPAFRPNLTPQEIFSQGAFGGTYWQPIHSRVTGLDYEDIHKRYAFLVDIDESLLCSTTCDVSKNKYKVHSGTSLEYWESKGWIKAQDPYGWVQWYCEFYAGRRSPDDERQIKRWLAFGESKGRFYQQWTGSNFPSILSMIKTKNATYNDPTISPVIR